MAVNPSISFILGSCRFIGIGSLALSDKRNIRVVAGLVISGDRVLISKRKANQAMPLYWEFPGGKIDDGESPERALKRELIEELGIEVEVGSLYGELRTRTETVDIFLQFFSARLLPMQTPSCLDVASWTWATKDELSRYRFLPADEELLKRLSREGLPSLIIA